MGAVRFEGELLMLFSSEVSGCHEHGPLTPALRGRTRVAPIPRPKEKFSPGASVSWIMRSSADIPAAGDDPRVQLLEQGEAGFFWPARDERELKHDEVVGVIHADERRRVKGSGCAEAHG